MLETLEVLFVASDSRDSGDSKQSSKPSLTVWQSDSPSIKSAWNSWSNGNEMVIPVSQGESGHLEGAMSIMSFCGTCFDSPLSFGYS